MRPLASLSRESQTVGTAPSSISMLPACGRVVVLPHPCNTGPTGMTETGAVDKRLVVVAGHPEVLRNGATCLMSAALFTARSPQRAASNHVVMLDLGRTARNRSRGVIIAGTISVHTHGSQQRSAARFDKFHLGRAGGCLEPGRVGEAVVHRPSSIVHRRPSRAYESARCNTCRIREGTRCYVRLRDVCFSTGFHRSDRQTI